MNGQMIFHRRPALALCLLVAGLLLAVAGCASPGAVESAATLTTATAESAAATDTATAVVAAEDTLTPPPATTTGAPLTAAPPMAAPATTAAPAVTRAGLPTATPAPTPAPLPHTLVLYTALTAIRPNVDPNTYWDPYYGFKTLPALPFVDPAVFDALYGKRQNMGDISMFFFDFRAQPSPDNRYVVVPGLHSYPEYGVEGTGTWLLDLAAGETRQLLPDGVIATWNPASDAITYVDGGVLYTLSVAPGAMPQALLEDENLWPLYTKWSTSGDTIATLIAAAPDESDANNPRYFVDLTLVPVDGAPARRLNTLEVYGVEYVSDQVSWSPDGQYVLAMNVVYDLDGRVVSPDYDSAVYWLPGDNRLLLSSNNGLDVITITGEMVAHVSDQYSNTWAVSHDGRRLAYIYDQGPGGTPSIAVYDLEDGQSWEVQAGGGWPLRWSGDDSRLILGTYEVQNGERPQIISISAAPGGGDERLLLDYAQLIEVVPLE